MRRIGLISLLLVALAGALVAWLGIPAVREELALRAITSDDATRRAEGWQALRGSGRSGEEPPAARMLDRINRRLQRGSDMVILDAASALRLLRLWGWSHQPESLVAAELEARMDLGDPMEHPLVAEALIDYPLELPAERLLPIANRLLREGTEELRPATLRAALAWAGPLRMAELEGLSVRDDDVPLRRVLYLAHAAAATPRPPPSLGSVAALATQPLDLVEAALTWAVWADREDASAVLAVQSDWPQEVPRPPFASVLRYSLDPRAAARLESMAAAGDPAAAFARQAASIRHDEEQARQVLARSGEPAWLRRMAAWRVRDLSEAEARAILDEDPAEPGGSVFAAVLLAERTLPRESATALAESWIRDFDDDRKRAGAMLAALLGVHGTLLEEAHRTEDVPAVRTVQRLVLHALGRGGSQVDPVELAHRAMHAESGDFDPDIALCLLAAGHTPALRQLTSQPQGDWRLSVQQRSWLIERFAPQWQDFGGRPIGGEARGLRLYFDLLDARALLEERRLIFDHEARIFRAHDAAAFR